MPSWYKIWLLNGCNHIRAKPILLREQERVHESFSSRRKSQMSRILIIPWNLAKLVKNCPGIIVNLHLAVPKQMVLLKEQYAESRENLCKCCCNQAWTKNGGRIPWDVIAICGTYKTFFFVKRRHHLKGDVVKPETIFWTVAGNCVCQSSVPKGESFPIPLRFF